MLFALAVSVDNSNGEAQEELQSENRTIVPRIRAKKLSNLLDRIARKRKQMETKQCMSNKAQSYLKILQSDQRLCVTARKTKIQDPIGIKANKFLNSQSRFYAVQILHFINIRTLAYFLNIADVFQNSLRERILCRYRKHTMFENCRLGLKWSVHESRPFCVPRVYVPHR